MGFKALAERAIPLRWQVPVRFWARYVRHLADRELFILRDRVRSGSTVVDVGANAGHYTYILASRAEVHAFEPLPDRRAMLAAYARRRPHIHVHSAALSDADGSCDLHVPLLPNGKADTERASFIRPDRPHRTLTVPVRTLDSYEFRNVSVLKIDVEGHEMAVLRGGQQLIARERPVMLIELEARHQRRDIRPALAGIEGMGYTGHFLDASGESRGVAEFDPDKHQSPDLADAGDHRYVFNFLFLPA